MIVQKMQEVSWPEPGFCTVPVYILVYIKYSNVKCGKNCCYDNKKRVKRFLSHNSNVSIKLLQSRIVIVAHYFSFCLNLVLIQIM